jgi:hypothetical protein
MIHLPVGMREGVLWGTVWITLLGEEGWECLRSTLYWGW